MFAKEPDDCVGAVCGGCGIDHITEHRRREQDSSSPSSVKGCILFFVVHKHGFNKYCESSV